MRRRHALAIALLLAATAVAHEHHDDGPAVVPAAERSATAAQVAGAPTQNRGVRSVAPLAAIDLGAEFEGMAGRQLRGRIITLEPGGVVAIHEHHRRPGFAYILEGEVVENRPGVPPRTVRAGEHAIEGSGVVHWWENRGTVAAKAFVVDIVPEVPAALPAQPSATGAPAAAER